LSAGSTAWSCSSDRNLKTNITSITGDAALSSLLNITGVTFNWKGDITGPQQIGVIAQDVLQAYPQAVSTSTTGFLSVQYDALIGPIISGVNQLNLRTSFMNMATTSAQELTTASSTVATSTPWVGDFASASAALQSAMQTVSQQIVHIFNGAVYATTGIFDKIFAKEVHTDELCVGSTCVSQSQFLQMVQQSQASSSGSVSVVSGGGGIPAVTPSPTPTPDPGQVAGDSTTTDPSITPTPAATSAPTPSPTDTPAPTVTPTPDASSGQ
jgi:hypothetical protein